MGIINNIVRRNIHNSAKMKSAFLAVAAGAVASSAMTLDTDVQLFKEFKKLHSKVYESDEHEMAKFETFKNNVAYINSHNLNSDKHGFTLGINHLTDLTNEEYRAMLSPIPVDTNEEVGSTYLPVGDNLDSKDWRTEGYVTPVKNQGQCGSCWAFSTVASLEGQYFRKNGKLVSLSEQQLVDCSRSFGNMGCSGGLMDNGFRYIKSLGTAGLDLESSYSYTASNGSCHASSAAAPAPAAAVTGFTDINSGNENDLTNALSTVGPISVAIDASHMSFQFYKSGVYSESACSSRFLDHGVTAVGFGSDDSGAAFYIVKNSWGETWGEQGYIKMARNANNMCGIATTASYPLL